MCQGSILSTVCESVQSSHCNPRRCFPVITPILQMEKERISNLSKVTHPVGGGSGIET